MSNAISHIRKSRGRPKMGATQINLRLPPDQMERLDAWIDGIHNAKPSRPEAIRRLIELGLKAARSNSQE